MQNIFKSIILSKDNLNEFISKDFFVNKGLILSYFNQNTFNIYFSYQNFREIFNEIRFYQEGIGSFIGLKFLGLKDLDRLDATNINEMIFIRILNEGKRFFLIGGNYENSFVEEKIFNKFPQIVGYHGGFFDEKIIPEIAQKIKESKAEFILLAMGQPKQELTALKLKNLLPDLNYYCVGNFFNFYLGVQRRAPIWIRKLQLEWFYRFLIEPKRMFKRYIIGIPLFFIRILRLKFNI